MLSAMKLKPPGKTPMDKDFVVAGTTPSRIVCLLIEFLPSRFLLSEPKQIPEE